MILCIYLLSFNIARQRNEMCIVCIEIISYLIKHSPFNLGVENSNFSYAVHDICIYGKILIYFQMIIPCPCIHPLPYTFMMTSAIKPHYIFIILCLC